MREYKPVGSAPVRQFQCGKASAPVYGSPRIHRGDLDLGYRCVTVGGLLGGTLCSPYSLRTDMDRRTQELIDTLIDAHFVHAEAEP